MANKNIQMKMKNGSVWDDLFPKTIAALVGMANGKTLETYLGEIVTSIAAKATSSDIDTRIQAVIGSAPTALDTLNEIAAALNDDPNFAATITTQLSGKLSVTEFNTFKDGLVTVTSSEKTAWNNKADKTVATASANGLMSSSDKSKLDSMNGVVVSTTAPSNTNIWYQEI